ncbi:hypothetical protein HLH10_03725 [Acinetobacter sp. ANC 4277]|uniref:hypothetical protein n=1 Tax=Acinetobacter terrae TaxID=2731247 RepID=UPI0014905772|nr:hypothetical protein [Acinetobacter terrae]NNG75442.1 hypothetical protein [Acinetobacter terrae]
MQLKCLSLSIITALTLIGCGGSSSDSTSNNNTADGGSSSSSSLQQWHTFEIDGGYVDNDPLQFIHNQITLDQGNVYVQDESPIPDNDILITQDGVYQDLGPKNSKYGYLTGTGSLNNLVFTHKPYSPVGSTGLIFTTNFKKIDLSGKNALATLESRDQWDIANNPNANFSAQRLAYYNSVKDLTFPAGAYCLQNSIHSNNQENLYLYTSDKSDEKFAFDDYAVKYAQNNKQIFKKTYKDTIAYLYSYDGTDANATHGAAEYKGNYYGAGRYLEGVEYSLAQYIQKQKDNLSSTLTDTEHKLAIEKIESSNNECSWYNDTAAQVIQNSFKP